MECKNSNYFHSKHIMGLKKNKLSKFLQGNSLLFSHFSGEAVFLQAAYHRISCYICCCSQHIERAIYAENQSQAL